jgi:hypothetical protein
LLVRLNRKKLPAKIVETTPEANEVLLPRVRHVLRLESMINVGCKYGPDDLAPEVWDELIALSMERAWVDKHLVHDRKKPEDEGLSADEIQKRDKVRRESKIPPAGGTIFPQRKPLS